MSFVSVFFGQNVPESARLAPYLNRLVLVLRLVGNSHAIRQFRAPSQVSTYSDVASSTIIAAGGNVVANAGQKLLVREDVSTTGSGIIDFDAGEVITVRDYAFISSENGNITFDANTAGTSTLDQDLTAVAATYGRGAISIGVNHENGGVTLNGTGNVVLSRYQAAPNCLIILSTGGSVSITGVDTNPNTNGVNIANGEIKVGRDVTIHGTGTLNGVYAANADAFTTADVKMSIDIDRLDVAEGILEEDPAQARIRYGTGLTLLHDSARVGDTRVAAMELLLSCGADRANQGAPGAVRGRIPHGGRRRRVRPAGARSRGSWQSARRADRQDR